MKKDTITDDKHRLEWKSVTEDKPELGSTCVVIDINGRYLLRKYVNVCIYDYTSNSRRWIIREDGRHDILFRENMFIPVNSTFGPIPKRTATMYLYYMELPNPPQKVDEAREMLAQIDALKKRIRQLGVEA